MYVNGKMRPMKLFQKWGKREKENGGGVNSTMIYCKNFYKCHPQYNNKKVLQWICTTFHDFFYLTYAIKLM
jgi:hypothetical protein